MLRGWLSTRKVELDASSQSLNTLFEHQNCTQDPLLNADQSMTDLSFSRDSDEGCAVVESPDEVMLT